MGASLLPLLMLGKQIIGWVTDQAALLKAKDGISDEDFNRIKAEAGVEDTDWDARVAAAKARLEAGGQ